MFDLLVRGGTVVDPAQGLHAKLDVAVSEGKIAKIEASIPATDANQVVDATGNYVAPGLIDIHAHIFRGDNHRDPDEVSGVFAGVTTALNAGGVSSSNIEEYQEVTLSQAKTKVYTNLGLLTGGSIHGHGLGLDVEGAVRTALAYPDLVKGFKIHLMPNLVMQFGLKHIEAARQAARSTGNFVLMHTGDLGPRNLPATPPEVTSQALDMLDEGDIVDHVFGPLTGGVVDQNMQVLPALRAAKEGGVYLNTAVGDYQFGWAQADALLAQGPPVDFIASDIEIHSGNPNVGEVMVADGRTTGARVAFGQTLVEYMASFLKLGFSLDEVIRMATAAPAKAMGIEDTAGSLKVGLPADIVVLELLEGHFKLTDATGVSRVGNLALVPVVTLKAGTICPVSSGTHDWGFAPPRATAEEVAALA